MNSRPDPRFSIARAGKPIFESKTEAGVSAFVLAALAHGNDVNGSVVNCERIDLALARLLSSRRVNAVCADSASSTAKQHLSIAGIELTAKELRDPEPGSNEQLLAEHSAQFEQDAALFQDLRSRVLNLLDYQQRPTDAMLLQPLSQRWDAGGGGT